MAKEAKLLQQVQEHLQDGESVAHGVGGTYETKVMGQDTVRAGVLVATDRRVVFYAKKLTGYDLESFPFSNISSLEMGKNMMGHHVKFFASGNEVRVKWIKDPQALDAFMAYVRGHMGSAGAAVQTQDGPMEKIKKLAELRDAGAITKAEFEQKKAKLLEDV